MECLPPPNLVLFFTNLTESLLLCGVLVHMYLESTRNSVSSEQARASLTTYVLALVCRAEIDRQELEEIW